MSMKTTIRYILFTLTLVLGSQFCSCAKKLFGPENGKGSILIRLSLKETSENASPDFHTLRKTKIDVAEAVVIVTGPDMDKIEKRLSINSSEQRASGTIEDVPAGSDRTVRVELNDMAGQLIYFGETKVTVESNQTTAANIDLKSIYEGMVFIAAGEFNMGSNSGTQDESPMHTVHLDNYWIDRYEVTNLQYVSFLNKAFALGEIQIDNTAVFKNEQKLIDLEDPDCQIAYKGNAFTVDSSLENFPIICVSWYGAAAYAEHYGKRLPTEAEWEKSSRGADDREYPWSNVEPTNLHCNFDNFIGHAITIGQYSPTGDSPYSCSDMAGNVNEWCVDWYDREYYTNSPNNNPQGPSSGSYKVVRGGSWNQDILHMRCANRDYFDPTKISNFVGFRCVR